MLGMFGIRIISGNQLLNGYANGITPNVLRPYDGRIENLIINRDVSAAIAKPLLAAGFSHKLKKNGNN